MKKRIFTMLMVVAMVATMLVGCGDTNDTNTETTNDTTENTEVVENTEGVNLIPSTEEETPTFSDDMSWKFPSGMEGFTDKWIYADDETWSYNQTHYVAKNGNVMDFKWEGPTELGEKASATEKTLFLEDKNDNYMLIALSSSLDSLEDAIKYYDKETIVTVAKAYVYTEGEYYKLYDEETYDKVIFKVTTTLNDVNYTGYACYMDDYATMTTYQFIYLERVDMFDDERALSVAESLDFWNMEIVE